VLDALFPVAPPLAAAPDDPVAADVPLFAADAPDAEPGAAAAFGEVPP